MPLTSTVKFETGLPNIGTIPREEVPEKILAMIKEVRSEIGKLDSSFAELDLKAVIEVIETGQYSINGTVQTRIDLSAVKGTVLAYRDQSEGGCQSCAELRKHYVCPPDTDAFTYCGIQEGPEKTPKECGYGVGWSPLVKKHYQKPCNPQDWKPRLTPKLDVLIEKSEE